MTTKPRLADIKALLETSRTGANCECGNTTVDQDELLTVVAALEAVIEDCRTMLEAVIEDSRTIDLSNYSQPVERAQARFTLRKICEHLNIDIPDNLNEPASIQVSDPKPDTERDGQ